MTNRSPRYETRLAQGRGDLRAAQRLRYEVFIEELGGNGDLVDHEARLETDAYDPFYDHLLLLDHSRPGAPDPEAPGKTLPPVVGVYRLLPGTRAAKAGGFYSQHEYDLSPLIATGRALLELGRSCVHADYRGGAAMVPLWNGLAQYVIGNGIEIMFGVASFHGTDIEALKQPLSYLHHTHLAPEPLRARVLPEHGQRMDLLALDQIDKRTALKATPALIRGYLRLGGFVGEGAFIDHAFNTTDIMLVIDTEQMSARERAYYTRKGSK